MFNSWNYYSGKSNILEDFSVLTESFYHSENSSYLSVKCIKRCEQFANEVYSKKKLTLLNTTKFTNLY